jgi:hypothetical protein
MRRGGPRGAPPQVRNFMNRPIRGPAFLELDEITGLLRPGSLAKLLKPPPQQIIESAPQPATTMTPTPQSNRQYQYTTELEARRQQHAASNAMKQHGGQPQIVGGVGGRGGVIDFSADMLVEDSPSRPMSSSEAQRQRQAAAAVAAAAGEQLSASNSVLSLKSQLLPSDKNTSSQTFFVQPPNSSMPEDDAELVETAELMYVGGGESFASTEEGILHMGVAEGGSTLGPLGAGSSYLRPQTAPHKRKQPQGTLRPMTAGPSRQHRGGVG